MVEWFTREEAETDPEFGSLPEKRSNEFLLNEGIVIIDKPFGPTSNQVSMWIKKELDVKKTGHFGTLDPNATGVLPVAINSATRLNEALANADKEYVFEAELEDKVGEQRVRKALKRFKGENKQVPPEKSAVKREQRTREVYEISLIEKSKNRVLGKVSCESGFYVRVLIDQLGERLDTGSEMVELRRTRQGSITESQACKIQDVVDEYHFHVEDGESSLDKFVYPREKAVEHLKKIAVKDSAVNAVANGADLGASGISKLQGGIDQGETVAVMTLKGELIALAESQMNSESMYSNEGTAAILKSVHMDPETYPKRWKQT